MPATITKRLFDVDDYHRMAEAGILREDDRVELIDGEILAMTPTGPRHNAVVDRAARALILAVGERAIVRVQGSVRLSRHREPQPDFAILRPQPDFYASRMPGPDDILLIIEIAESSADYDREVKARVYAESGLGEYWFVDLNERSISCYSEPHDGVYHTSRRMTGDDVLTPLALAECSIAAKVLLPDLRS